MPPKTARTKKQQLLLLLPLLLIPVGIIAYLLYSLAGKGDDKTKRPSSATGFNRTLPSPNLNKTEKNKLEIYMEAQKDSLRRKEQEASDPNIKRFYDPAPDGSSPYAGVPSSSPEISKILPGSKSLDQNEAKVKQTLAKLYEAMNAPGKTGNTDILQSLAGRGDNNTDRLERMIENSRKADTATDPQARQWGDVLDKVLDIKYPERVAVREKKTGIQDKSALPVSLQASSNIEDLKSYANSDSIAIEEQNSFFSFAAAIELGNEENENLAIRAVIHENQTIENNSTAKLRLLQDIYIGGIKIPHGSFIYGKCHLADQRVQIELTSATYEDQVYPISLKVYDGTDGLEGISITGMASQDVAREGMSQGLQSMALTSLDPSIAAQAASASIETAKTLLSRKIKVVKVTLIAGHKLLLKANQKN